MNTSIVTQFVAFALTLNLSLGATQLPAYSADKVDQDFYTCKVSPHFTPEEDMAQVIQRELLTAEKSVYVSLFGITNDVLSDTLIDLHNRGVYVEVAVDKMQGLSRYSDIPKLRTAGIPIIMKQTTVLEHNKFAIVDGKSVITGSWNWSESANKQDNNTVILRCRKLAQEYLATYSKIRFRDLQPKE